MHRRKKSFKLYYLILIGWLFLLACNFEPLKTINEMYSAPWYLLAFFFFVSFAVFFTIAFREGKVILREIMTERKKD